ncbi:MAG: hypothetical protein M1828_003836 [Chrysothrix sp. TS-e1954]|nr:MAG: hypothetical protein M1828_003836 [Chrysothrix sp. TS-e1954]
MDGYDSDSSLEGEASGVSTNVLLGYATKEQTEDTVSHLGGAPAWLNDAETPSAAFAQCKSCSTYMALLLQLNGDLPERFPGHERRLYLWACRRKACRRKEGTIRATRAVRAIKEELKSQEVVVASQPKSDTPEASAKSKQDLGAMLFGSKSGAGAASASNNPFSTSKNNSNQSTSNPFSSAPGPVSSLAAKSPQKPSNATTASDLPASFAEKARISPTDTLSSLAAAAPVQDVAWPSASDFQKSYPQYFLDADYEYLSPTTNATNGSSVPKTDMDIDDANEKTRKDGSGKEDNVLYEDSHDKAFQRFADMLSQNPEQVMRYEFDGQPLLYSHIDDVGKLWRPQSTPTSNAKVTAVSASSKGHVPACTRCGSERTFELQLTPHAISELESEEEAATVLGDGMEWGTILLFVCKNDCGARPEGTTGYVEEWVGVQWEEVVPRSKR